MNSRISRLGWHIVLAILIGCSGQQFGEVFLDTVPVSGTIYVDGEPAEGVMMTFVPEDGTTEMSRRVYGRTNADGEFVVSTYKQGDGLPAGTYYMTFKWPTVLPGGPGPDRLKGLYDVDPTKSQFKVTVEQNQPQDVGTLELSTKKAEKAKSE